MPLVRKLEGDLWEVRCRLPDSIARVVFTLYGGTMRKHIGSYFDEFLKEEGLLGESEATAAKRVIAFQLSQFMKEHKLSKSEMARRIQTSRSALDRLLDASNSSVTLRTLDRAAQVLGRQLRIALI